MKTLTVMNANLFQIAADEYGDPAQATRLAQINGLSDFFLTGQITLQIPPPDTADNDGLPRQ